MRRGHVRYIGSAHSGRAIAVCRPICGHKLTGRVGGARSISLASGRAWRRPGRSYLAVEPPASQVLLVVSGCVDLRRGGRSSVRPSIACLKEASIGGVISES
jgi:hypothetical protein